MALWYDKKAYALLKKCSDAKDLTEWNRYREETNHVPINLRFADLQGFYLVDADLSDVDLRGALLVNTKSHSADFNSTNIGTNFYWYVFIASIFISLLLDFGLNIIGVNDSNLLIAMIITMLLAFISVIGAGGIIVMFIIGAGIIAGIGLSSIVGITIGIVLTVVIKELISAISSSTSESIVYAKNPEEAIGFDIKYLKDIAIPLSARSDKEIVLLKELLSKEESENAKQDIQDKIEELKKEKETALIAEAHAKTQQIKIQNALNHILKPYEYMERNISKLRRHNYFFYGVIGILLTVFIYALSAHYLDARSSQFLAVLQKDTVSFGSLFGVILFYATPILFGMSIIVYAIAQINKNIQNIEGMQEQRRAIEVLQSTLLAQTEIADVSDDEIKALTQALQKGALDRMFGKEKPTEKTPKEKSTYREKLLITNLSKALTQALK